MTRHYWEGKAVDKDKKLSKKAPVDYYSITNRVGGMGNLTQPEPGSEGKLLALLDCFHYNENTGGKTENQVRPEQGVFEFKDRSAICCAECMSSLLGHEADAREKQRSETQKSPGAP